ITIILQQWKYREVFSSRPAVSKRVLLQKPGDVSGLAVPAQRSHLDAVGTTITDRPPHRTVRARLRIRLPPWMGGEEAFVRIRMQNAGCWNPVLKDRSQPTPQCAASLTGAAQDQPPQTPKPL